MFPALAAAVFTGACASATTEDGNPAQAAEPGAALVEGYQRLMDLHDEVMPLEAEIARTGRALGESGVDAERAAFAKTRLERASEDMMTWMYNNEPLDAMYGRLGDEVTAEHLRIREKEIREVGDSMRVAIAYAQSLLR